MILYQKDRFLIGLINGQKTTVREEPTEQYGCGSPTGLFEGLGKITYFEGNRVNVSLEISGLSCSAHSREKAIDYGRSKQGECFLDYFFT